MRFVQFGGIYASKCAVADLCGIALTLNDKVLMEVQCRKEMKNENEKDEKNA